MGQLVYKKNRRLHDWIQFNLLDFQASTKLRPSFFQTDDFRHKLKTKVLFLLKNLKLVHLINSILVLNGVFLSEKVKFKRIPVRLSDRQETSEPFSHFPGKHLTDVYYTSDEV